MKPDVSSIKKAVSWETRKDEIALETHQALLSELAREAKTSVEIDDENSFNEFKKIIFPKEVTTFASTATFTTTINDLTLSEILITTVSSTTWFTTELPVILPVSTQLGWPLFSEVKH
jgi:ABC-type glycerol-3-phosphate transport system permease component